MKKLLIFGYTMNMGGAEKALLDTIKYLHDKIDIDLYLFKKEGVLISEIPNDVNIYELKKNKIEYLFFRFIPFYRKYKINRIYNEKKYDYVFGYMEGRCATWVSDIKSKYPKKYAWIHTDVSMFDIGIKEKEIIKSYNNLDKIICVSNDAKKHFVDKYKIDKNKVQVIYNYINEEEILKKASEFKINNKVFTFVNVASLRDAKRQDRLIKAAAYLKKKHYKFQIQLIGTGPNLNMLEKMIDEYDVSDCVKLLGLKVNPYPYIQNADYFVLCSDIEGYGIVIKEALLLKTKVLTTDVTGPKEILENGKYGIIVPNDDKAIMYTMENILKNPREYQYLDKALFHYQGDNEIIKKETLNLLDL